MSYTYNPVTPEIIEQIKEAANGHVILGDDINEDFAHDEMRIYGQEYPDVVVEPRTTEEVAAVVKICNDNKIPVTPSGARTALTGAPVSVKKGVMISTLKMNKILGYDEENLVVRIQPGVLLNDLAEDALKHTAAPVTMSVH